MRGPLNEAGFRAISGNLGIDFEQIKPLMDNPKVSAEISRNRDIAIDLGILGTPAFLTRTSVQFGSSDMGEMSKAWLNQ